MKQNIWKVLDDYNRKKAEEVEQIKLEKSQKQRDHWVEDLNKQILNKQKRLDQEKARERQEDQKHVEYGIQIQAEQEQQERNHKQSMKNIERENHRVAAVAKEHVKRIKSLEKDIEALNMDQAIDDYVEDQRKVEQEKLRKRKLLLSMKTEDFTLQNKRIQEKRAQDKERDVAANQRIIEKIMQDEEKSATFLKQLNDRARNVKDATPAIEKGYDNLRKYGQIGSETTERGALGFMNNERHNAAAKYEKKKKLQEMLKATYAGQTELQLEKSKQYKSYIEEQKDYWKKEEEDMNLREEAGVRVSRLKKQALKLDLDAQREIDSPLKNHFITPTEVWVNRKILKQLQSIPENFSDKISYLKNL